jgi:hypothetical protein
MARVEHMVRLLANAKISERKSKMFRRIIWGGKSKQAPRPMPVGHVYRVYDPNKKVIGEYTSLKKMAKHAFNGALSREELVARMRHKLPYNGCTIVKEKAPETARFYIQTVSLPASVVTALEVVAVHLGKPAGSLLRQAITDFVNQEAAKLPEHLKEHL